MDTDKPSPGSKIPELWEFERWLLVAVIVGAFGVGTLGLLASFETVGQAAKAWGFHPPWLLPLTIDASIPVFSLAHLLLIRADMPLGWVRIIPWSLTGLTVVLNVASAGDQLMAKLSHGAVPLLWVACSEIGAHVYRALIGAMTGRRMERVRKSRWILSPVATARLWRRMILWEETSYRRALARERDRVLARADLRERYGWKWRQKASRRQRVLLRLGELAPEPVLAVPAARAAGDLPAVAEAGELAVISASDTGDKTATTTANNALTCDYVAGDNLATAGDPADQADLATPGDSSTVAAGDSAQPWGYDRYPALGGSPAAGDSPATTGGTGGADLSAAAAGAGDNVATTGEGSGQHRRGGDKKRRPMAEWVELAGPIYKTELHRLRRQPTGEEFAQIIADAGLGSVSASTAKNIRTAVVDAMGRALA